MRRRVAWFALELVVLGTTCVIFAALLTGGALAELSDRLGR